MAEENTGSTVDESTNHQEDATTNTDEKSGNSETPSTNDINVDDVLGGWSEDRNRNDELERENFDLKRRLAETKSIDDEEDEELDMDERVSREIKRRESNTTAEMELDKKLAERQVAHLKVRSPYFRNNEEKVLKFAIDAKVSLSEANKIMQERDGVNKKTVNKADDKRKKNASQDTSKKSGKGTVGTTKYDPKTDGEKSISELLREGL